MVDNGKTGVINFIQRLIEDINKETCRKGFENLTILMLMELNLSSYMMHSMIFSF